MDRLCLKITFWATLWTAASVFAVSGAQAAGWLTGEDLRAKLAQRENVFWDAAPLRPTLEKFCRLHGVALLIDRRVDPGQAISGSLSDVPVAGILQGAAESRGLGVSFFGSVVYLGPPEAAARLRTLAELRRDDVRRLSGTAIEPFARSASLRWDDFAEPRALLEDLAASGGIEIAGLDRVPHDLWAAADLPAMPLSDRITLVAAQFDLTFHVSADGRRVTLVPVPDEVALIRSYPAGRDADAKLAEWKAPAPDCQMLVRAGKIYVKGRLEEIERIEGRGSAAVPASSGAPSARGAHQYTLRVVNKPLGAVLDHLGSQIQLDIEIDRAALARAGVSLNQLVSFSTENAGVDKLLEALLEPAGCTFRREGETIVVTPAD